MPITLCPAISRSCISARKSYLCGRKSGSLRDRISFNDCFYYYFYYIYPINCSKQIMAHFIQDTCIACGTCIDQCPTESISEGDIYKINADTCIDCGDCAEVCPTESIIQLD